MHALNYSLIILIITLGIGLLFLHYGYKSHRKHSCPTDSSSPLQIWGYYAVGFVGQSILFHVIILLLLEAYYNSAIKFFSAILFLIFGLWLCRFFDLKTIKEIKEIKVSEIIEAMRWWYPNLLHPFLNILNMFFAGLAEVFLTKKKAALVGIFIMGMLIVSAGALVGFLFIVVFNTVKIQESSFTSALPASGLAVIIFGFISTCIWLVKKIIVICSFRHPRLDSLPPLKPKKSDFSLKFAHLSDLHIPITGKRLTESENFPDKLFSRLSKSVRDNSTKVDVWLITGDITDMGDEDAWRRFESGFFRERNTKSPVIFAPGNHDLNMIGFGIKSLFLVTDNFNWSGRITRLDRYLSAAEKIMGRNADVLDSDDEVQKLPDALITIKNLKLKTDISLTAAQRYERAASVFPMFVTPPAKKLSKFCFVVWNSVRPTAIAINNSFGCIDDGQLRRFKLLAKQLDFKDRTFIHLLHHKIVIPTAGLSWKINNKTFIKRTGQFLKARIQLAGMVLENSAGFLSTISELGNKQVIVHGHHHSRFAGVLNKKGQENIFLFSAPSTTLGTESWDSKEKAPSTCGFDTVRLQIDRSGSVVGASRQFQQLRK